MPTSYLFHFFNYKKVINSIKTKGIANIFFMFTEHHLWLSKKEKKKEIIFVTQKYRWSGTVSIQNLSKEET